MIPKRVIPYFLVRAGRLVKGERFGNYIDVGDPLSQSMVYDAQGADEIIMVDIDASKNSSLIDTKIIEGVIAKCRLPITVGGGIRTLKDAEKCFLSGADRIMVNTHAIYNPALVKDLVGEFGSQAVVACIDVVKNRVAMNYEVYRYSEGKIADVSIDVIVKRLVDNGVGELVVTAVDLEGLLSGFDVELYRSVRKIAEIPLIASGGAGCYDDMVNLFTDTSCDACAIGKMLFLRDYDIVRIKSYLKGRSIFVRES